MSGRACEKPEVIYSEKRDLHPSFGARFQQGEFGISERVLGGHVRGRFLGGDLGAGVGLQFYRRLVLKFQVGKSRFQHPLKDTLEFGFGQALCFELYERSVIQGDAPSKSSF